MLTCYVQIRILLSCNGELSVTASPTAPMPSHDPMAPSLWLPSASSTHPPNFGLELLVIHVDEVPTPSSVFTRTKTTHRDCYTAARSRFNIPPPPTTSCDDVLLYNESFNCKHSARVFPSRSPRLYMAVMSNAIEPSKECTHSFTKQRIER